MNIRLQAAIGLALIGLSTVAITHKAQACGLDGTLSAAGHWSLPMYRPGGNLPLALPSHPSGAKQVSAYGNPLQRLMPITGLYQFTFTAEGNPSGPPDGTVVDQGFVTWHADGTEIQNSGKNPPSQSFCMGVWERTAPRSYALNHYALGWDPTGQVFIGPVNIRENITLAHDNNSYSGDFSIVQYAPDGITPMGGVQGTVTGTRLTVDSN